METYTTDNALAAMGFGKFQALVLLYAGMGWVGESMEVMLLSFVGPLVWEEWKISPSDLLPLSLPSIPSCIFQTLGRSFGILLIWISYLCDFFQGRAVNTQREGSLARFLSAIISSVSSYLLARPRGRKAKQCGTIVGWCAGCCRN